MALNSENTDGNKVCNNSLQRFYIVSKLSTRLLKINRLLKKKSPEEKGNYSYYCSQSRINTNLDGLNFSKDSQILQHLPISKYEWPGFSIKNEFFMSENSNTTYNDFSDNSTNNSHSIDYSRESKHTYDCNGIETYSSSIDSQMTSSSTESSENSQLVLNNSNENLKISELNNSKLSYNKDIQPLKICLYKQDKDNLIREVALSIDAQVLIDGADHIECEPKEGYIYNDMDVNYCGYEENHEVRNLVTHLPIANAPDCSPTEALLSYQILSADEEKWQDDNRLVTSTPYSHSPFSRLCNIVKSAAFLENRFGSYNKRVLSNNIKCDFNKMSFHCECNNNTEKYNKTDSMAFTCLNSKQGTTYYSVSEYSISSQTIEKEIQNSCSIERFCLEEDRDIQVSYEVETNNITTMICLSETSETLPEMNETTNISDICTTDCTTNTQESSSMECCNSKDNQSNDFMYFEECTIHYYPATSDNNSDIPEHVHPETLVDCSKLNNLNIGIFTDIERGSYDEALILSRLMVGKWETMLHRSDPLDPLFKCFGISYIKRVIVDKLAIPLTIQIENNMYLRAIVHLPVGNRYMNWRLDGKKSSEEDPDCGTWVGIITTETCIIPWFRDGTPVRALQQVRTHQRIGVIKETRAILPDSKHGRILYLNYKLQTKKVPTEKIEVTRILKPI